MCGTPTSTQITCSSSARKTVPAGCRRDRRERRDGVHQSRCRRGVPECEYDPVAYDDGTVVVCIPGRIHRRGRIISDLPVYDFMMGGQTRFGRRAFLALGVGAISGCVQSGAPGRRGTEQTTIVRNEPPPPTADNGSKLGRTRTETTATTGPRRVLRLQQAVM